VFRPASRRCDRSTGSWVGGLARCSQTRILGLARPRGGLVLLGPPGAPQQAGEVAEEHDAAEDEARAQPVDRGEGVLEVPDGEEQGQELPEGEHECGGEGGALGGQHEHGGDTQVLGGTGYTTLHVTPHDTTLHVT